MGCADGGGGDGQGWKARTARTRASGATTPRALGPEFRLPRGGMHHITMLNTSMFFARMPATFIAKFAAVKPDPVRGVMPLYDT
ncbi:hypothetical protein GTP55_00025 [Duganella sp. FT109W]|uniref:Uncharacterized protein n=2 Tax=Duganella margarita TaxID=2692170 RepID=A0ABW9W9M5_9BURK|nr:hypothetical protein [Duganella margarita]